MINEARNYYSINFVSRFDESPRYWLTDKIDSRKSIGMLSVSLPRSVSSMLFIYSFNFFSLSLQSIPLFLEIWISPPLEAAEISIEEGKERKSIERSSLTPHCCQQSADRSKEKSGRNLAGREGRGIRLFLNRETLWRSCPPDCPASWHCSYLARTCTITATRKRFVYRAFFQLVTGNTMPGVLVSSPRCRSLKIVLTKRLDRSNEVEEEVNNSL